MVIALSIIQVIICLAIVVMVAIQSGKNEGLGIIGGGSTDNFLSKSKAKSMDARLSRWTKWVALAFAVVTVVLNCI